MTADRNEALRLADAARIAELEQSLNRLQGNYLIAFERGRIAGIADMESRVHTCGPACSKAGCINRRLTDERDKLRAEVERYRHLRNGQSWPAVFATHDAPEPLRGGELDAAIDATRTHKDTP